MRSRTGCTSSPHLPGTPQHNDYRAVAANHHRKCENEEIQENP
jgi:hypothetical protein